MEGVQTFEDRRADAEERRERREAREVFVPVESYALQGNAAGESNYTTGQLGSSIIYTIFSIAKHVL